MAELKITAANFENEVLHSDKPVTEQDVLSVVFVLEWKGE